MARMRYVKPEFWTDSTMVRLSRDARLFYIGTWNFTLCDEGHLEDDVMRLKLQIFPLDDVDCGALLDELMSAGRIVREDYATGDGGSETVLRVVHLGEHQKVDVRWKPRCPACKAAAPSPEPAETLPTSPNLSGVSENSAELSPGGDRRGGEGIGEESVVAPAAADATTPRKRGTRIPEPFVIDEAMRTWATEHAPDVDVQAMADEFVDYWRGIPGQRGVKLDWVGTWRNHMRKRQQWHDERAAQRPGGRGPANGRPRQPRADGPVLDYLDRW